MQKGNVKLFKDREKLNRAINLRINGYALTSLAILFNCHYTSIEEWCFKYGITEPDEVLTVESIIAELLPPPEEDKWFIIGEQRFNKGRDYKDYFKH